MKKISVILAVLLTVLSANAQDGVKSVKAATKALESAKAATLDAKKNTKMATWFKYGQALVDAYNSPAGNAMVGMNEEDVAYFNGNEKAVSEETVTLSGQQYTKKVYDTKNYYYDAEGKVAIIEVTQPIEKDALTLAVDAFAKAAQFDNGAKTKDIVAALNDVNNKLNNDGVRAYTFGEFAEASRLFEAASVAKSTKPCSQLDSAAIYNAAMTALLAGDNARAKSFYEKCEEIGYYGNDGDVFTKLSEIATKDGNADESKAILERGFVKFPESQSIIVGLINAYMGSDEGTDRIFELLDKAKVNEPNNASLYYVEGDIRQKLGQTDEAIAAFDKCSEINPDYEFGYIGKGILFYNKAFEYSELASNENDDAKWKEYVDKLEVSLKACVEPFEKAFEIVKDPQVKKSVAEYLKNACFRFREQDDTFKAKYEKYAAAAE